VSDTSAPLGAPTAEPDEPATYRAATELRRREDHTAVPDRADPVGPDDHADPDDPDDHDEPHESSLAGRLNWLRAAVLGANDGIVSVGGLVVGVAGATTDRTTLITAGVAGLVSGAVSMGLGEYVSVSSQRDTQQAALELERRELAETPEEELAELTAIYQGRGLSEATARRVAEELTEGDALAAHAEAELGFDPADLNSPVEAALASAASFTVGALLPVLAVVLPPPAWRVGAAFVAVLFALAITGAVSARLGRAPTGRAIGRVVIGGALGLAITYGIGALVGTATG